MFSIHLENTWEIRPSKHMERLEYRKYLLGPTIKGIMLVGTLAGETGSVGYKEYRGMPEINGYM